MKNQNSLFPKSFLRYGFATALAVSLSLGLQAQTVPAKQWDKTFGGDNFDEFYTLDQTTDAGFIIGGWSSSSISGDKTEHYIMRDIWVVRLNSSGNKVWDKAIRGLDDDYLSSIQQTTDGGFILGGYSGSNIGIDKSENSRGMHDYWVVKLNSNGIKVWDKTFGGNDNERISGIQQTLDGGYILGGFSSSDVSGDKTQPSNGKPDYWVVKLDANGTKIWDKTLGGSDDDYLTCIQQTLDGGFIMAGRSSSDISGDKSGAHKGSYDYWVVKLDINGNKQWDKTYGGNGEDKPTSIQQTSDGGYIIGGTSTTNINGDKNDPSKGSYDFWVIKIDSLGIKQWDRSLGGTGMEILNSLKQTIDGGYILGGYTDSNISGDKSEVSRGMNDFWCVKLDGSGNKIWDKTFGGSHNDYLFSIKQTSDAGFILGGQSWSSASGDKNQACQGISDYWIVKLGPEIVGLNEPAITFNLSISPNPNQGKFNLQLNNLKATKAEVTVTDLLGRVVLQKELPVTDQKLSEDITLAVPKGMYVLQVKAGEEIISRKIVVE